MEQDQWIHPAELEVAQYDYQGNLVETIWNTDRHPSELDAYYDEGWWIEFYDWLFDPNDVRTFEQFWEDTVTIVADFIHADNLDRKSKKEEAERGRIHQ